MPVLTVREARQRRHRRVRGKVQGTAERPRLVVSRSNKGIAAQLVDDMEGRTLAAAGWQQLKTFKGNKTEQAGEVGKKNLFKVPKHGTTITHEVLGRFDAARVLLRPASEGTGVIAGGGVRAVLELGGVRNVLAKSLVASRKPRPRQSRSPRRLAIPKSRHPRQAAASGSAGVRTRRNEGASHSG